VARDILAELRKRRLRSANASIRFTDTRDRIIRDHAQVVKEVINSDGSRDSASHTVEGQLSFLYRKMWQEYYQRPLVRYPKIMSKRGIAFWGRVAKNCDKAGVTPEVYMRAQFNWFHRKFGRPPELLQLATENALSRVVEFLAQGKNPATKVIGNDIRPEEDKASLFRRCEKQLRDICRAQKLSREDFYRKLVVSGLVSFPQEFLDMDPIYRNIINE
jgi:hypothetical protein